MGDGPPPTVCAVLLKGATVPAITGSIGATLIIGRAAIVAAEEAPSSLKMTNIVLPARDRAGCGKLAAQPNRRAAEFEFVFQQGAV